MSTTPGTSEKDSLSLRTNYKSGSNTTMKVCIIHLCGQELNFYACSAWYLVSSRETYCTILSTNENLDISDAFYPCYKSLYVYRIEWLSNKPSSRRCFISRRCQSVWIEFLVSTDIIRKEYISITVTTKYSILLYRLVLLGKTRNFV